MTEFALEAFIRDKEGKGASRRLRRLENKIPAVVYGGNTTPQSISVLFNKFTRLIEDETAFSHILTLNIEGKPEKVLIKDLQRHPAKSFVMHIDFMRVNENTKLRANIPLHFINEDNSIGIKQQGGSVSHMLNEVEILSLPKDLPEFIEVDFTNIEVGSVIHLSDLEVPDGVELVALTHGNNLAVASIIGSKASESTDE